MHILLQEARANFRQTLTESTQQLNALAKKLGSCIEKARPYYEARLRLKEVGEFFQFIDTTTLDFHQLVIVIIIVIIKLYLITVKSGTAAPFTGVYKY